MFLWRTAFLHVACTASATLGRNRTRDSTRRVVGDVEFVVRTFHGARAEFENLVATMRMFVQSSIPLHVILDEESGEDHQWGVELSSRGFHVHFESIPKSVRFPNEGSGPWGYHAKYSRFGYHRQQWSSFHFDKYTQAQYIGVLDSDTTFFSLCTPDMIWSDEGRIIVRGKLGDSYEGDVVALRQEGDEHRVDVNFMHADVFPMFFLRDSFPRVRQYISGVWGLPFDLVFSDIALTSYNWQNIIYQYSVRFQPDSYTVRLNTGSMPTLSCASHRNVHVEDMLIGCVRSHRVPSVCLDAADEPFRIGVSVLHYNPRHRILNYNPRQSQTWWWNRTSLSNLHYRNILRFVSQMPEHDVDVMKEACMLTWRHFCKRL
eukprot:TRINITY_DN48274_c0_g1_i1.p1 TRINITY_DN48274_c0_g1~~TRINITY_DN48274_c0_g1_i1.p1  ORF type:complete len:374 (-),score=18.56 TRINITY_DN48274_c0_g1_i1:271-1392(-)